jgi:hypothetical protein
VQPYIFCHDICNTIPWLRSLGPQRTQASSGYIFCCSPSEAKNLIPEFPDIVVPRPITTTRRTQRTTRTRTKYRSEENNSASHSEEYESRILRTTTTRRRTTTATKTTTTRRTTFGPFPCKKVDPKLPKFNKCNKSDGVWDGKLHPVQNFSNIKDIFYDIHSGQHRHRSGKNHCGHESEDSRQHKLDRHRNGHHSQSHSTRKHDSINIGTVSNWLSKYNSREWVNSKGYTRKQRSNGIDETSASDSLYDWQNWNKNGSNLKQSHNSHNSSNNPFVDLEDSDNTSW